MSPTPSRVAGTADAPVEFVTQPAPLVGAVGRSVRLSIGSAFTLLTPDSAADLQAQLQRAEGEARAVALRSAQ